MLKPLERHPPYEDLAQTEQSCWIQVWKLNESKVHQLVIIRPGPSGNMLQTSGGSCIWLRGAVS